MVCRNTAWRQGSLLKQDELRHLGLAEGSSIHAIVISHDCDIPHPKEEFVEIILCNTVAPSKMFLNCRNPRKLHLGFEAADGTIHIELSFQSRIIIPKSVFDSSLSGPNTALTLSEQEKRTLKQWLSSRFGRPAYPNAFEARLQKKVGKDTIEKCIAKLVEPVADYVVGLFIGLDGDKNVELPQDEPYCLSIFVVYNTEKNGSAARKECEALAAAIQKLIIEAYGPPHEAKEIILERCAALADSKITLVDLMKVDQWRLEWISLNDGDPDFIRVGQP